ncbi:hypothetical protein UCRPC4_g05897 [Phaeomoniella chlamydospora]|uniref:Uncharacterized protein n=1 Tax=Phaeomoniella chlamydospora TaxID=158046 RepID=A0A0G2GHV3_PHACM|nr:hypothetical protein UCRPC4_g05897 [Phaeomoniella chlamydospora]
MKKRHLVTVPMVGRNHNKYAGEADDPHFIPTSPLIERQTLAIWQDAELTRACTALVENVKVDERALINGMYMANRPVTRSKSKYDKHASFTFSGPKTWAAEAAAPRQETCAAGRYEVQGVNIYSEPREGSHRHSSRWTKAVAADPEQAALREIRSKLEARPKTSAAACIDYTGGDTSSSSNRTTFTTPFTSAGITPGSTNKRFSELVLDLAIDGPVPTSVVPRKDSLLTDLESYSHYSSWIAEDTHKRHQRDDTTLPIDDAYTRATRSAAHASSQPNAALLFPTISRRDSIKNGIKEYIRPGSSHQSIHSVAASNISSRSHLKSQFAAICQRFSRRGSSTSSNYRPGRDDGDEYLINASQIQFEILNKPLPPFPALDTYNESAMRPRHLADLAIRAKHATIDSEDAYRVIDERGDDQVLSAEEAARRREEMSRAVLEKMTTGSIGSGGVTSPANRSGMQTKRNSGNAAGEESQWNRRPDLSRTTTGKTGVGSDKSRPFSLGGVLHEKDNDTHGYYYRSSQNKDSFQQQHISRRLPDPTQPKLGEVRVISAAPPPLQQTGRSYGLGKEAKVKPYALDTNGGTTLKGPKSPFFKRVFGKGKTEKVGA